MSTMKSESMYNTLMRMKAAKTISQLPHEKGAMIQFISCFA